MNKYFSNLRTVLIQLPIMGRTEAESMLSLVSTISDTDLYVRQTIIPAMMQRRGRAEPLSGTVITQKLFSIDPKKPGEAYELIVGELLEHGWVLTPPLASEIADIIYYTSQPNCPAIIANPYDFLSRLGVSMDQARKLCILKYTTRLEIGDDNSHKQIENAVLKQYLESQNNDLS